MKTRYNMVDAIMQRLSDIVRSKEVLGLVVKGAVMIAFDKKLVSETQLREMLDDAINAYHKNK